MIRPLIAGNWKMFKTAGESLDFVRQLKEAVADIQERDVVIAPPFTSLYPVGEAVKGSRIYLAAQNLSDRIEGAYTGEISARMLIDTGCTYVIVGHSERRMLFGEQDETINRKTRMAIQSGLKPIFCIGETMEEWEAGKTFAVIEKQIKEGLNQLTTDDIRKILIAYEPVWAIGTGKTAAPEQAQEVHAYIRRVIARNYENGLAVNLPIL
ncbi:MAG: triose-phosphate isomerase, partial [Deltaproteobacteria bacterium]|nr:triose-phosphate isomerase [Deltaproteobacteria bacterium]